MPDHVEHLNGVNEVGKLSAEAVVREYEAAVKEIEALGTELQEAAKKCEAMVAGVHSVTAEIKEFARDHRFATTNGSDNIIAFTTNRYSRTPLVVQGPGAGADVTAALTFEDDHPAFAGRARSPKTCHSPAHGETSRGGSTGTSWEVPRSSTSGDTNVRARAGPARGKTEETP